MATRKPVTYTEFLAFWGRMKSRQPYMEPAQHPKLVRTKGSCMIGEMLDSYRQAYPERKVSFSLVPAKDYKSLTAVFTADGEPVAEHPAFFEEVGDATNIKVKRVGQPKNIG